MHFSDFLQLKNVAAIFIDRGIRNEFLKRAAYDLIGALLGTGYVFEENRRFQLKCGRWSRVLKAGTSYGK